MVATYFMRAFATLVTLGTLAGIAYVFVTPPQSLGTSRDGVPFFTPPVVHPETGDAVSVDALVRHFKGE